MRTAPAIDTLDELAASARPPSRSSRATPPRSRRRCRDYARGNPALVVKGGLLGQRVLHARTRSLRWPTCRASEVMLAQLAGAPAGADAQFASLLAALPRNFAYGLKALLDQQGGRTRR